MNSTKLRKQIEKIEDEISELKGRENSLSNELESLAEGIATNFDDSESRTKIRELKSDKDILSEVISKRQEVRATLLKRLQSVTDAEQSEERYQRLVDLAKKAEELEDSYRQKISELDEVLRDKVPAIIAVKRQWRKVAKQFMKNADQHSPGFLEATRLSYNRQGKVNELKAEQLLETLKSEGVNFDSAMRATILESRYYSIPLKPLKPFKGLVFHEAIEAMTKQRNVPELIQE